jgi:hypothetical protein
MSLCGTFGAVLWRLAVEYEVNTHLIKLTRYSVLCALSVVATGGRVYCGSNCEGGGAGVFFLNS